MKKLKRALIYLAVVIAALALGRPATARAADDVRYLGGIGYTGGASWLDGIPLGENTITKISQPFGIISGITAAENGPNSVQGQKFRASKTSAGIEDLKLGNLAYCLNYALNTPIGPASPAETLTDTEKQALELVLLLGYQEIGSKVIKGSAVANLTNLDAYVVTQWLVQEIVQPEAKQAFELVPQINQAVEKFRSQLEVAIGAGLGLSLASVGQTTQNGRIAATYQLVTNPAGLAGTADIQLADIQLDNAIPGAILTQGETVYSLAHQQTVTLPLGATFTISVPDHLHGRTVNIEARAALENHHTFVRYAAPNPNNQQPSIVLGDNIPDKNLSAATTFTWTTQPRPSLSTMATAVNGSKIIAPTIAAQIIDEITLTNLNVGESYTLEGQLFEAETGQPLEIDGAPVTAGKSFVPDGPTSLVTMTFTFDATKIQGRRVVVYQTLKKNGWVVARHHDRADAGQTVTIGKINPPVTDPDPEDEEEIPTTPDGPSDPDNPNNPADPENPTAPTDDPLELTKAASIRPILPQTDLPNADGATWSTTQLGTIGTTKTATNNKLPQANESSHKRLTLAGLILLSLAGLIGRRHWHRRLTQ
ncbi:VaFE repeat-containing surface-anchored protein [Lapidilactobacillus achengensis]|uniref:VaFE repeat-containing surface-anchored protein n=1 Tax=Lapidilactobacillus achengensis TaxID=2486000 RepID=A0ABW1USE7_9LACO|nr:VaFE repeat-containing surface-anchored protein [Lapidilactobacillus achengensis]